MQTIQAPSSIESRHVLALSLILLGIALIPLALVHIPPLVDYPNHMARMQILADAGRSAYLKQYYEIHWDILPNLAMDVLVPPLSKLVGIQAAGKLFIGMTMALLSGSIVTLHYVLHRRWSWWPLLTYLFLFNSILLWGFLNYLFGLGLAFLFFAGWVVYRQRPYRVVVPLFSIFAVLLFFAHLFALGIYVLLLSGYEVGQWWSRRSDTPYLTETAWIKAALPLLLPGALLLASPTFRPLSHELPLAMRGTAAVSSVTFVPFSTKIEAVKGAVRTDHQILDRLTAGLLIAMVLGGLAFRCLRISPPMVIPLSLVGIAALVMPSTVGAMSMVEIRTPLAFLLVTVAGSDWRCARRGCTIALAAILASLFVVRMAYISFRWQEADHHYTQFVQALERLPEGARLFSAIKLGSTNPVEISETRRPEPVPMANLSCWAVIVRGGFVSNIFAAPSQQPIELTPAYRAMPALEEFIGHRRPIPWDAIGKQYDFLVVRRGQRLQPPLPPDFVPTVSGEEFQFYRLPGR